MKFTFLNQLLYSRFLIIVIVSFKIHFRFSNNEILQVVADEDGLRGAWFSAQVLDVKDGKAYVCYKDLLSDEGKIWLFLELNITTCCYDIDFHSV